MCGRYTIEIEDQELREVIEEANRRILANFGGKSFAQAGVKVKEIFPFDIAPVLVLDKGRVSAVAMRWGFPLSLGGRAKKAVFNARSETALEKQTFARPLQRQRVVVPTNGFYEWSHPDGKRAKDKFLFTMEGERRLYLAGMYELFELEGVPFPHFTVLTTAPNDSMVPYHNRMPVLLRKEEQEGWLSGQLLREVLGRVPEELVAKRVA